MSYDKNKGLIAIATGYSNKKYTYTPLNLNWIQMDTIASTPDQVLDIDTNTNGNGILKRTVFDHTRSKWEANTSILYENQVENFIRLLQNGFAVKDGKCTAKKRHLRIRYYNEWKHGYEEGTFYVPDITFNYKLELDGELLYQPIKFSFIEL